MSNPANSVQSSLSRSCLVISPAVPKDVSETLLYQLPCTSVPTPSPRCLRSLPAVEKIHPTRSGIELSSLPKSSQLCPVATLPCLGSLEISGRREVTLMSPGSTLPAPRSPPASGSPGAVGKARSSPAQLDTAKSTPVPAEPERRTAHLHALRSSAPPVGARGESSKAGGTHVFRGMHRHRGRMALRGTLCFLLHLCPCDMSFSLRRVGLPSSQSVSSVTSVLLTQGFVVSPVPDSTNTRELDHTF